MIISRLIFTLYRFRSRGNFTQQRLITAKIRFTNFFENPPQIFKQIPKSCKKNLENPN
jgi:hypothetical protein